MPPPQGLSVDYSVHIAHGYMTRTGTADERLIGALEEVGTGVVNGGLSTWLAVLLLGASNSYVFVVFFRALFLCTTLGIANGLLFLPVLLSLANPKPHSHADESEAAHSDGKGGKGDREPTVTA